MGTRHYRQGDCVGEWVCAHGPCPVRAVRLCVRAAQAAGLPRLRCPLCLRTLEFRRRLPGRLPPAPRP